MSDLLTAVGLALAAEGLLYGGFPAAARRMAAEVQRMPDSALRVAGIAAMALGVIVIWAVRG